MDIEELVEEEINPGVIEKFLNQLPEKAFHLGLRVVLAALVLFIGIQVIRVVRSVLKKALKRSHVDEGAVRFIDSFVKFGMYFILILLIASGLGVDAASILALLGSASVAVGLAVQGSLSNLAGGVLLLILKPFIVGEYIKDGVGNEGTVEEIDIFYTQLRTPDNKIVALPNGNLANTTIVNFSRCSERRIDILVGIAYEEDIRKAKEVLEKAARDEIGVVKEKEIIVFVDSLGESSVNLNVRCWASQTEYWNTKWHLTEQIKYALDEAGISIPFPQLDVHFDKE